MTPANDKLVDKILQKHLAPSDEMMITASEVARYVRSPFAFWCDHFAPEEERDAPDRLLQMRMERGIEYEEDLTGDAAAAVEYTTWEEGFRLTLEQMAAGVDKIYQGVLISKPAGMMGLPDQLIKVRNSKSIFGNYSYRIVEIKSQFNIHRFQEIQAAFYNQLLFHIQDRIPSKCIIINGQGEENLVEFKYLQWQLDQSLRNARQTSEGMHRPSPVFGQTPFPWSAYGDKLAQSDLTRLRQVGPYRRDALIRAGYMTIENVAETSERLLASIPGLGVYAAGLISAQAKALVQHRPIPRKAVRFPQSSVEIFVDFENLNEAADFMYGTSMGFVNYLFGLVVRTELESRYVNFFAETPQEEKKCWQKFCEFVTNAKGATIYYWSKSAEPVYIRKLAKKFGIESATQDKLQRAEDLYDISIDSFAFPTETYGLKDITEYLGYERKLLEWDGMEAMIQYKKYLDSGSSNATIRSKIIQYNEEDCRATMFMKDWLVAHSL